MLRTLKAIFKSKADHDKDQFCYGYLATMRALIVPDIVAAEPTRVTQAYNNGCERANEDHMLCIALQKARIKQLQNDLSHAKIIEEMLRERIKKTEDKARNYELKANSLA